MIFLNALVHRTGSTAAAGKALQELLQQEGQTDADSALHAWATVLVKPDRATGGGDFKNFLSRPRDGCWLLVMVAAFVVVVPVLSQVCWSWL